MPATRSAALAPLAAGAAILALTATLSACGSPAKPVADAHAQVGARAAKQPHAPSPAKSPAHVVPIPTPTRPCTTADVTLTPAHRHETDGVQIERFTLTPTIATGCTLTGPPHIVPRGPLSPQIPTSTVDLALSQQGFPDDLNITPPEPTTIPITPAKPASFYLAWFAASPVVCVQSNALAFNAPADTTYTDMRVLTYPVGPICDGLFYVSSVF
jgi:hypothetical protein